MSEEEIIKTLNYQLKMKDTDVYTPINYDAIQGLLDLYYKQQKEITRLQNIKRKDIQDLINAENENIYKNYIHKDKIRKKLEKIEELYNEKAKEEKFEYTNNQFIVDFIALVEELLEV